jgi:glycosidase
MEGGDDPEMRGPMRWDLVTDANAELQWMRRLIALRQENRALRIGDFRRLDTVTLLAFQRRTDRVADTVVVVANPTDKPVTEIIPIRDSQVMNGTQMRDQLSDLEAEVYCGFVTLTVSPHATCVMKPLIRKTHEYSPYKRVR